MSSGVQIDRQANNHGWIKVDHSQSCAKKCSVYYTSGVLNNHEIKWGDPYNIDFFIETKTGLLQLSESAFPAFLFESSIYSSIFFIKKILFSSTEAKKTHQIPAWMKTILKFDDWMLPKCFNFTLFEWSFSPWLKKILKFDDLNASKTV